MSEDEVLYLLKILEVALIASLKFALSPFEAERYGFNFRESFLITTGGGLAGIVAFTFIGKALSFGWKKLKGFFRKRTAEQTAPKPKFTRSNKLIVRIKMRYGLIGLALTAPSLISIPIGTVVINHFYRKKWKNILALSLSLLFWSLIFNWLAQYWKLSQYLE